MELTRHDGSQAGQLVDELCEVYATVFTEPPFLEPAEQAELFAREDGRLHRWIRDRFAVAWFAVRPEARGRGIGSRLYDLLLGTTDRPQVWLVTHDLESPARAFYHRRGWRELGRGALGWDREERLVLGLERRAGQRRAATTM